MSNDKNKANKLIKISRSKSNLIINYKWMIMKLIEDIVANRVKTWKKFNYWINDKSNTGTFNNNKILMLICLDKSCP